MPNLVAAQVASPQPSGGVLGTLAWRDKRTWLAGGLICLIVVAAHLSGLRNGFNYDDEFNIIDNPHYRGLDPARLKWMFTTFHMGHYQPLSWISLAIDYLIWGRNPFGYHLTNLILHLANALLVYLLAVVILRAGTPASDQRHSSAGWGLLAAGGLAALLFAVHPLRVESVAWVTERRDVLSSFLLLICVLAYLHAQSRAAGRSLKWLGLALLFFLLSLLSRAMGVTLPLILLLLDWYPLGRLGQAGQANGADHSRRGRPIPLRSVLAEKIPFLALAVGFAIVAPLAQAATGAAMTLAEHGLLERAAQACYGLVFYLWKTVAPFGLCPLYELDLPVRPFSAKYLVSAAVVATAATALALAGKRRPWLAVPALAHAILLAPVLGFFQSGQQEVADRYSYLPAIGWAILTASGWLHLWRRIRRPAASVGCLLAGVGVIGGLAALTWRQTAIWQNAVSLWSHAVRHSPSPTTHQNLAAAYARLGRLDEAIHHYRASLELEPLGEPALYGYAKALTDAGRLEPAAQAWDHLLRLIPTDTRARIQYAEVLRARGNKDEAARQYAEVARLDPRQPEPHLARGHLLMKLERWDEAAAEYRKFLALQPGHPDGHCSLANALAQGGKLEEAAGHYRLALQARPDFPDAGLNLAVVLQRLGRPDQAVACCREVLQRHPDNIPARYSLALILAKQGQSEQAVAELREVLRRQPDHREAARTLNSLLSTRPAGG